MRQDLRHIHHVEGSPCHRPPVPLTGGSFLFSDGQVHHDTHALTMVNNVIGMVNYGLWREFRDRLPEDDAGGSSTWRRGRAAGWQDTPRWGF